MITASTYRLAALAILLLTPAIGLADAADGKAKAVTCAGCHGPAGISTNPLWPNLAGQQQQYLAKQLKAFRDGQRQDPVMAPLAQSLTDQDIADLAAYYNQLSPQ